MIVLLAPTAMGAQLPARTILEYDLPVFVEVVCCARHLTHFNPRADFASGRSEIGWLSHYESLQFDANGRLALG